MLAVIAALIMSLLIGILKYPAYWIGEGILGIPLSARIGIFLAIGFVSLLAITQGSVFRFALKTVPLASAPMELKQLVSIVVLFLCRLPLFVLMGCLSHTHVYYWLVWMIDLAAFIGIWILALLFLGADALMDIFSSLPYGKLGEEFERIRGYYFPSKKI